MTFIKHPPIHQALDPLWKRQYEKMFFNLPKRLRRTKSQINSIRSQAKLLVAIYS